MDKTISEILREAGFKFKKSLGQNFLTNSTILNSIGYDSKATKESVVLEIGAGAGSLTLMLSRIAKSVFSFEIDNSLKPVLDLVLKDTINVNLYYQDVLKLSDAEILDIVKDDFIVVANLPYYITTALIMRFIESPLPVKSLTLTMQKEVAQRLTAQHNTPEFGAITLAVQLFGTACITRIISRNNFRPVPNVDSAVVYIEKRQDPVVVKDMPQLHKLIRTGFAMRRKTLINNISATFNISKDTLAKGFSKLGIPEKIRGEAIPLDTYIILSDYLTDLKGCSNLNV
ncbi:MAG: 16S rRNA (adenine(1518)-N(6)/adenine(1519)-N(6))-dimethyltransferase RsmA [Christensenellaceae bacterium]|jgi:16S rRNA (adenine1518-N6/adenine1519-N6)-dimethyltransferase|nr:16S rRNA (adenine(1518)-N(6)/adenine(1519)-N(6))-dimethyltransferase RsmA [Christensenellaceae bacterium]